MRASPILCAVLTLIIVFAGAALLTQLNIQIFNNILGFIGCMIAGVLICVWGAADRGQSRLSRRLWGLTAFVLLVAAGLAATQLPKFYRFQERARERFRKVAETLQSTQEPPER